MSVIWVQPLVIPARLSVLRGQACLWHALRISTDIRVGVVLSYHPLPKKAHVDMLGLCHFAGCALFPESHDAAVSDAPPRGLTIPGNPASRCLADTHRTYDKAFGATTVPQ